MTFHKPSTDFFLLGRWFVESQTEILVFANFTSLVIFNYLPPCLSFWLSFLLLRNVMEMYCIKQKPAIIHHREFKDFNNDFSIKDLTVLLTKSFNEETIPFQVLKESVNVTLEKYASTKNPR